MPAKLLWRPQAVEDLMDIYVLISADSPDAAERVYQAIANRVLDLIRFPRMGQRRPDIAVSARVLVEGAYLVLYEIGPDAEQGTAEHIEIVRVVDGRRNLSGLFQSNVL